MLFLLRSLLTVGEKVMEGASCQPEDNPSMILGFVRMTNELVCRGLHCSDSAGGESSPTEHPGMFSRTRPSDIPIGSGLGELLVIAIRLEGRILES
jgi:hypothetical protein